MSTRPSVNPIRAATREWAEQFGDRYQFAVTLTLKPYRNAFGTHGLPFRQQLTPTIAWQTFAKFQHNLNRQIFRNAARRYGNTLLLMPMLEGERSQKLLHFHCAIGDVPDWVTAPRFGKHVSAAWRHTEFGNEQIDVQPYRVGWLGYMTKELYCDSDGFGWEHVAFGNNPS